MDHGETALESAIETNAVDEINGVWIGVVLTHTKKNNQIQETISRQYNYEFLPTLC